MIDMVKEKLVSHAMKLMQSPAVSKLMESEKMGAFLEKAMSVPIKLSDGFRAKRERLTTLFELATHGPGFEVDGPIDGEALSLPPFLEPRRAEIEAVLQPL